MTRARRRRRVAWGSRERHSCERPRGCKCAPAPFFSSSEICRSFPRAAVPPLEPSEGAMPRPEGLLLRVVLDATLTIVESSPPGAAAAYLRRVLVELEGGPSLHTVGPPDPPPSPVPPAPPSGGGLNGGEPDAVTRRRAKTAARTKASRTRQAAMNMSSASRSVTRERHSVTEPASPSVTEERHGASRSVTERHAERHGASPSVTPSVTRAPAPAHVDLDLLSDSLSLSLISGERESTRGPASPSVTGERHSVTVEASPSVTADERHSFTASRGSFSLRPPRAYKVQPGSKAELPPPSGTPDLEVHAWLDARGLGAFAAHPRMAKFLDVRRNAKPRVDWPGAWRVFNADEDSGKFDGPTGVRRAVGPPT